MIIENNVTAVLNWFPPTVPLNVTKFVCYYTPQLKHVITKSHSLFNSSMLYFE